MWLLKAHFGATCLLDNYTPLSCLIGGREEVFKILIQGEWSGPQCSRRLCEFECVGGLERGFEEERGSEISSRLSRSVSLCVVNRDPSNLSPHATVWSSFLPLRCCCSGLRRRKEKKSISEILTRLFVCVCVCRNIFSAAKMLHAEGDSEGSVRNWKETVVLEKRRDTNEQNQSGPDPCWLLKAACLCLQIDLKTVNNLFSQMIFNHPLKYLCALACAESCPLGFEMATNNRRRGKRRPCQERRSTNRRSGDTEQFEDERC